MENLIQKQVQVTERMEKTKERIWNPANALTLARIALIPVFILVYEKGCRLGALAVFLSASLTDLLDGWIARKYHMVTHFGKVIDPLADKLMCVAVLYSLASSGMADWTPVIVVVVKELAMFIGSAFLLKKGVVVQSRMPGKVAQVLFIVALSLCFFHDFLQGWVLPLDVILLWAAIFFALVALAYYIIDMVRPQSAVKKAA